MDLNNIELPIATVVDFYGDVLVIPDSGKKAAERSEKNSEEPASPWPALGGNAAQILVVSRNPETTYLPDNELAFLTRILTPCKLSLEDVAVINLIQYENKNHKAITTHFNTKKAILFGMSPVDFGLPVTFPEYQVQAFQGIEYLWAPTLSVLEKDDQQKRKFWESLKKIFNLNAQ